VNVDADAQCACRDHEQQDEASPTVHDADLLIYRLTRQVPRLRVFACIPKRAIAGMLRRLVQTATGERQRAPQAVKFAGARLRFRSPLGHVQPRVQRTCPATHEQGSLRTSRRCCRRCRSWHGLAAGTRAAQASLENARRWPVSGHFSHDHTRVGGGR
jgi:hypothetical protein